MRILLTMNLPYLPSLGGANKCNRLLCEWFASQGNQVNVVTPALGYPPRGTFIEFLDKLAKTEILLQKGASGVQFRSNGVEIHAVERPSDLRRTLIAEINRL